MLEARVGFEPTNGGFADLSLGPLGYRAKHPSIANPSEVSGRRRPHPTRGKTSRTEKIRCFGEALVLRVAFN